MYEVELKVPADHPPVRERLSELGADRMDGVVQVDTYFDAPDRSFADTDEALRIRRERQRSGDGIATAGSADAGGTDPGGASGESLEWERTALTYKGPKVDDDTQTRQEYETGVTDVEGARGILGGLGYEAAATVRKERDRFAVGPATVTLDAVEDLGTFVEVEIEVDDESAVPEARDRATELLADLGLDPDAGIRESYLELVLARR